MKIFFPFLLIFFSISGYSQALFCEDFEVTDFAQIQSWYIETVNTQIVPNGSYFGTLHANSLVDLNQNSTFSDDPIFKHTEVVDFNNSGNKALKFTLKRLPKTVYDSYQSNSNIKAHMNRNELATYDRNGYWYEDNKTYWFQWKTYLDPTYDIDQATTTADLLGQVHLSSISSLPPISINIVDKKWHLAISRDNNPDNVENIEIGPVIKGTWVKWKLKVKLSSTADGLIEFWKDDVLIHSETGKNLVSSDNFYFKIGVYKPGWFWTQATDFESTKTVYYDDFWADTTAFVDDLSLTNLDCHKTLTIEDMVLSTKMVEGSPTYEFNFTKIADNSNFFINSSTATIDLLNETRLEKGQAYRVSVRIPNHPLYNNASSKTCVVTLNNNLGLSLIPEDCSKTLSEGNTNISSIAIAGTNTYKFRVVKVSDNSVFFIDSPTPTINLANDARFEQGQSYAIKVRVTGHPLYGSYGASCTIMFSEEADCEEEITHNNQILATGNYLSNSTIASEATIEANSTVAYKATTSINLSPNFNAKIGSTFSASIENCEMPNPLNNPVLAAQKISTAEQVVQHTVKLSVNPNPFSGTTLIEYELFEHGEISLDLYTLTGSKLKSICHKKITSKGLYHQTLDIETLPKGIYMLVLKNEFGVITKKIVSK